VDERTHESEISEATHDPLPLWSDSPDFGVIEVGGAQPREAQFIDASEAHAEEEQEVEAEEESLPQAESSEAALFASIAPWPAVPVESISVPFGDSVEILESDSIPFSMLSTDVDPVDGLSAGSTSAISESEFEATTESVIENEGIDQTEESDEDDDFTLNSGANAADSDHGDESEEDTAIEKVWTKQVELLDDLEPDDFEDEELVINDHYAALDRASQAIAAHLPQAPELIQFLSQYSVKNEPRRAREAASMHQLAVEVAEPAFDTTEEELLATIRGLQEQLRQATIERPRPQEAWQESIEPAYDVVEPPEENVVLPPVSAPVAEQPIPEQAAIDQPAIAKPAEPVKSRFAQLFSRMRQRRREVEDRLRKNADWI
jgi:hypothetical protein